MKQTLQNLLAEGKTLKVITELRALTVADTDLHREVLQISARFSEYEKQKHANTLGYDPLSIERNKIDAALLALIEKLPDEARQKTTPSVSDLKTIANKKNTMHNSTIIAGGNVTFGVTTTVTESTTSRRIRLFLLVFVPILAIVSGIGYYQFQKLREPLSFTIRVVDAAPNPNIPFEKAKITLTFGDKTESQDVEKEATFKGIPSNFRDADVQIQCESEGFIAVQKTIVLSENAVTIPLSRDNSLAAIFGQVKDEKGNPVSDVQVSVQDIQVRTDASGSYTLPIPPTKQLKTQRVKAFKQGFKIWDYETPVVKGTPVDIILKK